MQLGGGVGFGAEMSSVWDLMNVRVLWMPMGIVASQNCLSPQRLIGKAVVDPKCENLCRFRRMSRGAPRGSWEGSFSSHKR